MNDSTMPHEEVNGAPLSAAEQRIGRQVDWEERRRQERYAARAILRNELDGIGWRAMLEDPTRGNLAAKLYDTWTDPMNRAEPFTESEYSVTGIFVDLRAAMNAHGLSTFDERCKELGKRLVESAITYILSCHEADASAVEDDMLALRRENDRIEAEMRRGSEYQREEK